MATTDLDVTSVITNSGWTNATASSLLVIDSDVATDGTVEDFISVEIENAPGDFGSQNSIQLHAHAFISGAGSRTKQLVMELRDSAENVLETHTTGDLTTTPTTYSSAVWSRSDSQAVIDGYRYRITITEGGGMPDSVVANVDRMWGVLDYELGVTFTPETQGFRIYDDDAAEDSSTPLGAEDTDVSVSIAGGDAAIQLRALIAETAGAGGQSTDDWQLQVSKNSGAYVDVDSLSSNVRSTVPVFVSTWETTNTSTGSSNSDQITLPLVSGGTYDFEVDWGDGSSDTITAFDQAEVTHTYAAAGEYELRITGTILGWTFANGGDRLKLLTVAGDGVLNPGSLNGAFYGCANMTSLAGLDASGVTNMREMFRGCSSLTSLDVTSFDTSSVTSMAIMFRDCSSLTSLDVTGFDTSGVTDMFRMFQDCSALTSLDVTNFVTSSVTIMTRMFEGCSTLTTLDVTGFDTSSVTLMFGMFVRSSSLTSIDVTGFDTSLVTDMREMFKDCSGMAGAFDPSGFTVTALTQADNMMNGTSLTTAVYDALLVNWEAQAVNDNVALHAGTSTYTGGGAAATARQALIDDHLWTFTDSGVA